MAPKTIRTALADMLEDLSSVNFDKFCRQLLDRREEPRVRRRNVEGKNFLDIADVLVQTFTEHGALEVALELLNDIGCKEDAKRLAKETSRQPPEPDPTGRPSAGAAGVNTMADEKHFVDKHKIQLIRRVSNIAPILDDLLDKDVLKQESYDEIRKLPTAQEKVRALYNGCLKAGGTCKDIFYKILEEHEKYLMADLKGGM